VDGAHTPYVLGPVRMEPTVGLPPLYCVASYPLFGVDVKKQVHPDRHSQVIAVLPGHRHAVAAVIRNPRLTGNEPQ